MTTTLVRDLPTGAGAAASTEPCHLCRDTGWADAWEAHAGSPPLTWCPACLGAGLDDCEACEGYGAVADPVACPACDGELFVPW